MNSRGQAEQIGGILMSLVVITTVVGVVTPAVLSTTGDDPFVGVDVTVTTDEVTVTNQGGDTLPTNELLAVVRYEGNTLEVPFDSVFGGTQFEHGSEAVIPLSPTASYGALVSVQVVHEPTGAVFYSDRRIARA